MNQNVHVDHEQLLAYLYGEADPGERAHLEAHLGGCPACAEEVAALSSTRQVLAGWAPPDVALGFQITHTAATGAETAPAGNVIPFSLSGVEESAAPNPLDGRAPGRGDRWWSRPMPAWAQAAAAVLIFGAGLAVGTGRTAGAPAAAPPVMAAAPPVVVQPLVAAPAGDERLAREVADLRTELASLRRVATAAPAAVPDQPLIDQVRAMLEESEQRQRIEFTARSAQLARDFEVQRRADLAQVNQTLVRVQGQAGAEVRQQRQAIEGLARAVSLGVR